MIILIYKIIIYKGKLEASLSGRCVFSYNLQFFLRKISFMDEKLRIFYELFDRRRSVREYQNREIEPEKLSRILEIARRAPSAANRQPWKFIILPKSDREAFDREGW